MPRPLRITLAVLLLTLAGSTPQARLLSAQEAEAPREPAPPSDRTAPPSPEEPPARPGPDPLDAFVPHERVDADSIVALPVDL
jgi:hypothetical protein